MPDKTSISIDDTLLEQFSNESILKSIDNVGAGFSFSTPFFPGTKQYRDLFRPYKYHECKLFIGGELIITGVIDKVAPNLTETTNSVNVQVRSKTGVIVDSSFQKSDFPIEYKQAGLEEIANGVLTKFNLETSFPDGAGAIFEKTGPESPTEKIFDYLQPLAKQRLLLMGQTNDAKLLFRKAKTTGDPVAELIEGHQGVLVSSADYDGTKRFSSYDVFGQEPGKNDNYATITDNSIPVIRPKAIQANDTNQGNIEDAARWALSADIAASINIPLGYEGWLRPDGQLWMENELIIVHAPSIMIYKPFAMLIKSVMFNSQPNRKTVNFTLTIPEAYTGQIPVNFPWDE